MRTGGGRPVVVVALAAYVLGLVVLLAGPWGWALNRLTVRLYVFFRYDWPIAPDAALPEHYGVLLNVVLFVPLAALLVAVSARPWWWVVLLAAGGSVLAEVVQGLWLARQGDWRDVAANTLGALIGAVAVSVWTSALRRRRRDLRRPAG